MTIYNPHQLTKQELIDGFVARQQLLDELLDDLRRGGAQHHLLIGDRGAGKTTLLLRLAAAIDDDAKLAKKCIALRFPEEQYNITNLGDLWLNALDALADAYERRGEAVLAKMLESQIEALDALETDEQTTGALKLLLDHAKKPRRLIVLLVDNLDLVLERLDDERWAMREALSDNNGLVLLGATSKAIDEVSTYQAPFYEFFQVHQLDALSEDDARRVVLALAAKSGTAVADLLDRDPGRFKALYILTGGTPRTLSLLHTVLATDLGEHGIERDLDRLLDQLTPYYKARLDDLPNQSQVVVDAVALNWHPIAATDVAKRARLDVNSASAQLNRLVKSGFLSKVQLPDNAKLAFQISERFFNIWYLMRASRRLRRRLAWFVEFLRAFYGSEELERRALALLSDGKQDRSPAELLAFASTVTDLTLRAHLESRAVAALVRRDYASLHELLDLEGEDAHLASTVERARTMSDVRRDIASWRIKWPARLSASQAAERLAGDPMLSAREKCAWLANPHPEDRRRTVMSRLRSPLARAQPGLSKAIASGEICSYPDIRTVQELDRMWELADDQRALLIGVIIANTVRGQSLPAAVATRLIDLEPMVYGGLLSAANLALEANMADDVVLGLVRSVLGHPLFERTVLSPELLTVCRTAIQHGRRSQFEALLSEPNVRDRVLPLREAIVALGFPKHLDSLAPEIRFAANDILRLLQSTDPLLARPAATGTSSSRRRR